MPYMCNDCPSYDDCILPMALLKKGKEKAENSTLKQWINGISCISIACAFIVFMVSICSWGNVHKICSCSDTQVIFIENYEITDKTANDSKDIPEEIIFKTADVNGMHKIYVEKDKYLAWYENQDGKDCGC